LTKRNFLLGRGERLTSDVVVGSGPPNKEAPYTIAQAKVRLAPMIQRASAELELLPAAACPRDEAVAALTLHPEYIAKSYYPAELLKALGVEAVGSKPRTIVPEKRSKGRKPEEAVTTELFVQGPRAAFRAWAAEIATWDETLRGAQDLVAIEEVRAPNAANKIKGELPVDGPITLEVVLHTDEVRGELDALARFRRYLHWLGIEASLGRRFYAGGLCFLQVDTPAGRAEEVAAYATLRVLRQMPQLRMLRPTIRATSMPSQTIELPDARHMDNKVRSAIFDGGLPAGHPLLRWANLIEPGGLLPPSDEALEHGVGVTSAFLFGHLDPTKTISAPYSRVDHHRVIDAAPCQAPAELYEVLERILAVLSQSTYHFVNISLGPILPVEDDDVHAWTSMLDAHLASGLTLATVAAGNTGEGDAEAGLNRIQVPADCVNALAIGACDTPGSSWRRALYSSIGPGRSPGLTKPDLVAFGGSVQRPFLVLEPGLAPILHPTGGTSFAAPGVLRLAAGVRAHFGESLDVLAIRALLVHCAEPVSLPFREVGRGRVARDLEEMVTCPDHMVRVAYQGTISPAKYIRAPIPLPAEALTGEVRITATLCHVTDVDPHHPSNYTRTGLEATFRPHDLRRDVAEQAHANTKAFFGVTNKRIGLTEEELRRGAFKWENCRHATINMRGSSLRNPAFDIHYNSRMEGHGHAHSVKLRYALMITVEAKRVADLYDRVVRRYATQLEPLRPVIEIPIRT